MEFTIKFKQPGHWFWKKRTIIGITHLNKSYTYNSIGENKEPQLIKEHPLDQALLNYKNGTEERIPEWSKCQLILKEDFFIAARKSEEKRKSLLVNKDKNE